MRVSFLDQQFHLEKKTPIDTIDFIKERIESSELLYSHVRIDGLEVFHNYQEYVNDHFDEIKHIEVKMITYEQLIDDVLKEADLYVKHAIPELQKLTDDFYQGMIEGIWIRLEQLVEAVQWFQETSSFMRNLKMNVSEIKVNPDLFDFSTEIAMLMDAVQQQDSILIGDILQYEFLPRFEQMKASLSLVIQNEVTDNDNN